VLSAEIDERWERVEKALENPSWDFRTIDGLAEDTGLRPEEIRWLINRHSDRVRVSNVPDTQGRVLYILASKPISARELLATVRAFAAKSFR
jgi:hypothetical protein